jgi:hypothetical protein
MADKTIGYRTSFGKLNEIVVKDGKVVVQEINMECTN